MEGSPQKHRSVTCPASLEYREWIEELFTRFHSILVAKATVIVGDLYAEDIVQDTWITLEQSWDTLKDIESVGPWLNRVVFNKSINKLKRERRSVSLEQLLSDEQQFDSEIETYFVAVSDDPEVALSTYENLVQIETSWYRLTANQKKACEMRFVNGYQYKQIADHLGVSITNSKVILHRAKQRLVSAIQ